VHFGEFNQHFCSLKILLFGNILSRDRKLDKLRCVKILNMGKKPMNFNELNFDWLSVLLNF